MDIFAPTPKNEVNYSKKQEMLPPFFIHNIQSPLKLVSVSAPQYDETLSNEPRATLKYRDDDGDSITIGSSLELEQCLGGQISVAQRTQLAELHTSSNLLTEVKSVHVFSVDSNERIKAMWQEIRENSKPYIPSKVTDLRVVGLTGDRPRKARTWENPPYIAENEMLSNSLRGLNFKDYRTHFFNTTNPTKTHDLQKSLSLSDRGLKAASCQDGDVSDLEKADALAKDQVASQRKDDKPKLPTANLTLEGKRQAQLAGEKFRARGLNLRPRKMSTGTADRQSYHNRWAMYNHTQKLDSVRATLTPDAKRQAQTAGDRLRSKTSRVRHVKAVSERERSKGEKCDRTRTGRLPPCPTQPEQGTTEGSDAQMTLLELFESELARKPQDSAKQIEDSPFTPRHLPSASLMASKDSPPESITFSRWNASSKLPSEDIENGIKTAVSGFEVCLRGIVDALKAAHPSKPDKDILAESKHVFQDLAHKGFLSRETTPNEEDQWSAHKGEIEVERNATPKDSGFNRSTSTAETSPESQSSHKAHRSNLSNLCSQDAKIQECVDDLEGLGFDMERNRLRIYASVSDGDLDKAIDIITEDQRVHDSLDIWAT